MSVKSIGAARGASPLDLDCNRRCPLLDLNNEILELTNIESRKLEIRCHRFQISTGGEAVIDTVEHRIGDSGLSNKVSREYRPAMSSRRTRV